MSRKVKKSIKNPIKLTKINIKTIQIALITVLIFCYLSVLTNNLGVIGGFLKLKIFQLIGLGAYFIPAIIIIHLVLVLFNLSNKIKLRNKLYIYALSLIALLIIDINLSVGDNIGARVSFAMDLAKSSSGAGLIGAVIGHSIVKYFGKLGAYLLSVIVLFFSILSFFDIKIKDFFLEIRDFFKKNIDFKKIFAKKDGKLDIREEKTEREIVKDEDEKRDFIKKLNKTENKVKPRQMSVEDFNIILEKKSTNYKFPPLELLKTNDATNNGDMEEQEQNSRIIEETMRSFKIDAEVFDVKRGPSVTCYELKPAGGVKVSSIVNLADNLALSLASSGIRIEAPIPGKSLVGIEVPNKLKDDVYLKEIICSSEFIDNESPMPLALGKDISGNPIITYMEKMPHLLIAGATGSGKSVCINTLIMSILFRSAPEDVRLILIDPKMVELNIYNGIPHLVIPVVTDPKKASAALNWAVKEMDRRYTVFSENSVRDINSYKAKFKGEDFEDMPYIVIIIDELSDLMMVAAQEVEDHICRLAQMARACGIHLVVATQRPSVDVITGTIKANIPSRISFAVSSQIDSRTILDMAGAEKLLGKGDMLFYPSNFMKPLRVQGAFISEKEVSNVVQYIKDHTQVQYDKEVISDIEKQQKQVKKLEDKDELLSEAIDIVIQEGQASVSLIQRKLRVGYSRAGRIIDEMNALGVVEDHQGSKPRRVLVSRNILAEGDKDEYSK
ncbi:MAG: DNA translocase FtsK 4TM domain-containing protein [Tissierellia bacterium]|nr:DNA translocase FtsK 4TM domain-containing protein [Tissierellia bacterium]